MRFKRFEKTEVDIMAEKKRKQINTGIDDETYDIIEKYANEHGMAKTEVVRLAVKCFVNFMKTVQNTQKNPVDSNPTIDSYHDVPTIADDVIFNILDHYPQTTKEIAKKLDIEYNTVYQALDKLSKENKIYKSRHSGGPVSWMLFHKDN